MNVQLNIVFHYICMTCYYYFPNKANKKKIKQLFECIPFFVPEEKQNLLFTIINKYPIETFYDSNETMRDYGYIIYRDYHIRENKKFLDYNGYMDSFYANLYKEDRIRKKWVKHIIFISAVVGIIFFLYKHK